MTRLRKEISHALRGLAKSPGFTVIALLTLTLTIGANTAMFTVVESVLLRPLAYGEPERIVVVLESNPEAGFPRFPASPLNFRDFRAMSTSFSAFTALQPTSLSLTGDGEPERLQAVQVSDEYFRVLGVEPIAGRDFASEEDQPGAPRVVILAHDFWQRRFAGETAAIGQTITLDGEPHEIVGVAPPGLPLPFDVFRPINLDPERVHRGAHFIGMLARLGPGVELEAAQTEMREIAARLEAAYPETNQGWTAVVQRLREIAVGGVRQSLYVLWGAVAAVLLIGCVNLANLQLSRLLARERELAVRVALGSSRGQLLRFVLVESMLLSLGGGLLGLLLAWWGTPFLVDLAGGSLPRANEVSINATVLFFVLGVALLTGLVFGLLPGWRASRLDPHEALKEGAGRGAVGASGAGRLRRGLVFLEVALAVVLLIGAGLLLRSLGQLRQVDVGFEAAGLMTAEVSLPRAKYREDEAMAGFYRRLTEELGAQPETRAGAVVFPLPLGGSRWILDVYPQGRPVAPPSQQFSTEARYTTPGYFELMGIPLLRGRDFTDQDVLGTAPQAIINEIAAKRFWEDVGEDPLGAQFSFQNPNTDEAQWWTVIGVVGATRFEALDREPSPEIYQALYQNPPRSSSLVVAGRATGDGTVDPAILGAPLRRAVAAADPSLPLFRLRPMTSLVRGIMSGPRFDAMLLGIFAAVALILAAIGVYGVVAYTVSQSLREIGIRRALGAGRGAIFGEILRRGLAPVVLGLLAGVGGAFWAVRFVTDRLFGVAAFDPVTFVLVPLLILLVAVLACLVPARRATRVDPLVILREE